MLTYRRGDSIGDYLVVLPQVRGRTSEVYRVRHKEGGGLLCLKLFILEGGESEAKLLQEIEHEEQLLRLGLQGLPIYHHSGRWSNQGRSYYYITSGFVAGEELSDFLERSAYHSYQQVIDCTEACLEALESLHRDGQSTYLGFSPKDIRLDAETDRPVLISLGRTKGIGLRGIEWDIPPIYLPYIAPECLNGETSIQSDIYAVGVICYLMLYGCFPHTIQAKADLGKEEVLKAWGEAVYEPLRFIFDVSRPYIISGYDERIKLILKKALCPEAGLRFASAREFISALRGEIEVEDVEGQRQIESHKKARFRVKTKVPEGKGFSAIVGMTALKEMLKRDVIDVLRKPELYRSYGLTVPNGMLLYGPPGCGKTFFAKHFAEELGFNFMLLTPAALKSRYVNATQENISKMFEEALEKAPTLIFIDEINELLPCREKEQVHEMSLGAVNEMLAQMDRLGERGVFLMGATNFPNQIDSAMLRSGRMEKKVYIAPPDEETRKALFMAELSARPTEVIDYEELSRRTMGYVSSDIKAIVDEAARIALSLRNKISMEYLYQALKLTSPSLTPEELARYERIAQEVEYKQMTNKRNKIGF